MWKIKCLIIATIFVMFEIAAAGPSNGIYYSRSNLMLPIQRIPSPRPAPSEVKVLEISTTETAVVTEPPPITTTLPAAIMESSSKSDEPGIAVFQDELTKNSEVVPEPVLVQEIIPEVVSTSTDLPVTTEPPVSSELPLTEELPLTTEQTAITDPPKSTELPVTTTEIHSTSSLPTAAALPPTTTALPPNQRPIFWNTPSKPLLVRPLARPTSTQRPVIMGRSPIIEGDEADEVLLGKPAPSYIEYENGHHFEVLDRNKNQYPLSTTTNIAIYQGPSTMACTDADSYFAIQNECEFFVECRRQVATSYMCPDGLFFNNKTVWPHYPCVYPSEVQCVGNKHAPQSSNECPRQYGFFSLSKGDCGKYLMCQEGKATIMECPHGLAFNPEKDGCDWPINVPSCEPDDLKGFICPEPLRNEDGSLNDLITHFSFHNSCKQYIACQLGHPRLLSCDLGYSYDHKLAFCARSELVQGCDTVQYV